MSRTRCHLTIHAKEDSIPLRLGRSLSDTKIYLDNLEEDEEGTKGQKPNEIARGNRHVMADLWTHDTAGEWLGRWRLVLGNPDAEWKDSPVVTVLPIDRESLKSEGALSLLLQRERQSGKHDWLTPAYVAETLHPLYRNGRLSRIEDFSEHIRSIDKAPLVQQHRQALEENAGLLQKNDLLESKLREQDAELGQLREAVKNLPAAGQQSSESTVYLEQQAATRVTEVWPSKMPNSPYKNAGVEATVLKVLTLGNQIEVTFIDTKGKMQIVRDFGYEGFVDPVFKYLKSREGGRAVFILTWKDDNKLRLASDTMLLPQYAKLWGF